MLNIEVHIPLFILTTIPVTQYKWVREEDALKNFKKSLEREHRDYFCLLRKPR